MIPINPCTSTRQGSQRKRTFATYSTSEKQRRGEIETLSFSIDVLKYTPTSPFVFCFSVLGARAKNIIFWTGMLNYSLMAEAVLDEPQTTMFNLESKEMNPYWVDPDQPLKIPVNPLHVKAHELQQLWQLMKAQAKKNGAQFNATAAVNVLNEYTKCVQMINEGKTAHDLLEQGKMAGDGESGRQAPMGDGVTPSLGAGVSPTNPLAG